MEAWITTRALTAGVQRVDGHVSENSPDMFRVEHGRYAESFHGEGREWHRSRESAVARAEAMRLVKIKSLEKQLNKLKALRFE